MLTLVAGIVLTAVGCLLMAGFGSLALLAPSPLAAATRAVAMAAVATAADGKRALTAPAMTGVKDGNLVGQHRSLQAGALDNRYPSMRGFQRAGCASAFLSIMGRGTTGRPRRLPGFSFSGPTGSLTAYAHPPAALRAG
jgi:hypothetical protein